MSKALYLDTSVVLRATLESGVTPEVERRIDRAGVLVTSRLSQVESARALHRLRQLARAPERRIADAEREIEAVWSRCDIWELTEDVCEHARIVAPHMGLRTLDALHLATFLSARRQIEGLELFTVDDRLLQASK